MKGTKLLDHSETVLSAFSISQTLFQVWGRGSGIQRGKRRNIQSAMEIDMYTRIHTSHDYCCDPAKPRESKKYVSCIFQNKFSGKVFFVQP